MQAYIIGQQGNYRNPSLIEQLGSGFVIRESNGFYELDLEQFEEHVDKEMFSIVTNRLPILGEVACYLAHIKAWRSLTESELHYLAVFEDDVELIGSSTWINEISFPSKGPWVISLERRAGDHLLPHTLRRKPSTPRSFIMPRGSGAYIISREAAEIGIRAFESRDNRIMGVLDRCPNLAVFLRYFIQVPPPFTAEESANSLIGQRNSEEFSPLQRGGRLLGFFTDSRERAINKWGVFILTVLRPLKYRGSVHFFTAWALKRTKLRRFT